MHSHFVGFDMSWLKYRPCFFAILSMFLNDLANVSLRNVLVYNTNCIGAVSEKRSSASDSDPAALMF